MSALLPNLLTISRSSVRVNALCHTDHGMTWKNAVRPVKRTNRTEVSLSRSQFHQQIADSEYGSQSSAESRRNQGIHLHFRLTRDHTRPTIQASRANLQLRHPLHCRCFLIPHLLFEPRQMPA